MSRIYIYIVHYYCYIILFIFFYETANRKNVEGLGWVSVV